jgi:uncharacterized membrane protein
MEFVIFLLIIILISLILILWFNLLDKMGRLQEEVFRLREEIRKRAEPGRTDAVKLEPRAPVAPDMVVKPPVVAPPPPAAAVRKEPAEMEPFRPIPRPVRSEAPKVEKAAVQATDWEKFIGENLISKIGIAILVLAIGFFVKYAIDNDWIGPAGRVGVGLICGGILIGLAHRLRNQYKAFSSVLIGGGLVVLYFTIALAYHQYHLFGQTPAFILMLVITAFSVALSLLYNREELAIIALVGGFVTPFLVSNGSGDYQVLFTYLLILNTGLLVIAYYKAWRLLNGLAFGFTVVLFGSWLIRLPENTGQSVYYGGAAFGTAFYGLYFIANVARTIREKKKFIASDFLILLLNTCLYFGVSLYFLSRLGLEGYKGLYCAIMGVIHIVLSWLLFRRQSVDKNILYLLIGITLSFVSLTAPLQLHGHYITLFWASESVLLYWLFLQSKLRLMRLASWLVLAAMLISLAWDWVNIYLVGTPGLPIIFNKGCMTGLYCAAACFVLFRLQRDKAMALVMLFAAAALLFVSGALEVGYQFDRRYERLDIDAVFMSLYTWLFLCVFTGLNARLRVTDFRALNMVLLGLGLFVYLISLPGIISLQEDMLEHRLVQGFFAAHWVGAAVVLFILYRVTAMYRSGTWRVEAAVFSWAVAIIAVIFLSAEGQMLVNMLFYSGQHPLDELQRVYDKTGLPILWGLCSFVCMWLGMRHKFRPLRIFSLVLFMVTLLKLFLFDIRNIPVAGKIAAFFCLGVLLLVVSFMYQRLKKIIIENEAKIRE